MNSKKLLLTGNEAVARGAWEAGVKVATAYPGTPSTEILEAISLFKDDIYAEWSTNEKVALEVAAGASTAGVRTLFAAKQVGINVAADPLFTLSYIGVNGGLVIVTADEPGVFSSQNEQDNRHYARFAKIPMLEPSDSEEARVMTKLAFEISEKYDTPVFLRLTTRICHTQTLCNGEERVEVDVRKYVKNPEKHVMIPAFALKRHYDVEERLKKLVKYSNETPLNYVEMNDKKYGVITSGISYNYAKEVLGDYSFLKLGMSFPLPYDKMIEFASSVENVIVIEENDPYLENVAKSLGIKVDGKEKILQVGELNSGIIEKRIKGVDRQEKKEIKNLPNRSPQFCPGCSHRGIYYLINKHKITVTGDIGCYGLGVVAPFKAIDTILCMGASVTMAHGFDKAGFTDNPVVGIIGDSTFWHSGITGLVNSSYNGGNSTIIIMDNHTTGMTGHQVNPSSGKNLSGEKSPLYDWEKILPALGVKSVNIVDGYDMKRTEEVLLEEIKKDCLSVIVITRGCALKVPKMEKLYYIDSEKCVGCMACMKMGCPALVVVGKKVEINPHFCTGCGVCEYSCKFGAIKREGE